MIFDANNLLLLTGMFLAAMLYSSVGHAGASAYLALMALFSIPAAVMRPTALALNILVASIVSARFTLAGLFRWRVLWPFLIGAVPLAFFGGSVHLPGNLYRPIVGVVLLVAAARLLLPQKLHLQETVDPPIIPAILGGGAIGFLSGLTGTGGGIFLSPLILFMSWAETRTVSGVAAVFILCNSTAGLLGNLSVVEAIAFPELFKNNRDLLKKDALVIVKGTVDRTEKGTKLISNKIVKIDGFGSRNGLKCEISIKYPIADSLILENLREALSGSSGECPLYLKMDLPDSEVFIATGFQIDPSSMLIGRLEGILGKGAVRITS